MKPQMDIVIVSNAKNKYLKNITEFAIKTCIASSSIIDFNFIIVEQNKRTRYNKPRVKTLHYNFEFNYHRCMNYGIQHCTSKYIALCNNDLDFRPFWAENIIAAMGDTYLSASPAQRKIPVRPKIEVGYGIAKELKGWCIVINKLLLEKIGRLDEGVKFWYSDNLYADQLRTQGIEHILVNSSFVTHLGSRTLRSDRNGRHLMHRQFRNYVKARKKYYENRHINSNMAKAKSH